MKKIIGYFFRGLLLILPITLTINIFYWGISTLDNILHFKIPMLGLVIILTGITLIGFLLSGYVGRSIMKLVDDGLSRIPLVKIVYNSIKDLTEAFVGEKKKFTEPVLVDYTGTGVQVAGFVTRRDLSFLGQPGKMAVYLPFAYSLTGNVIIVPADRITTLDVNAAEVMKFVVSAGVTGFHE